MNLRVRSLEHYTPERPHSGRIDLNRNYSQWRIRQKPSRTCAINATFTRSSLKRRSTESRRRSIGRGPSPCGSSTSSQM